MRQIYTSESTGKRTSRQRWLRQQRINQQNWIEQCEQNGVSYAGENGPNIRKADRQALLDIESQIDGEYCARQDC